MSDTDASDSIKMFIGQIPKSMTEDELREMMEEYGPILSLNILKDRESGMSKGCAFVNFSKQKDAFTAQQTLNNIKVMPGLSHPIQMKPADGQGFTLEERKVFVGMLSKDLSESDITMMFAPFGTIEDCVILKDLDGSSKGCAFISFSTRQCALNAIKSMHHSQTMKGCRAPLVVKLADTQKEKEQKKMLQRHGATGTGFPGAGGMGGAAAMGGAGMFPNNAMGGANIAQMAQYMLMMQQQAMCASPAASMGGAMAGMLGTSGVNPIHLQQLLIAAATVAPIIQANPAMAAVFAALIANYGAGGVSTGGSNFAAMLQQASAGSGNGQSDNCFTKKDNDFFSSGGGSNQSMMDGGGHSGSSGGGGGGSPFNGSSQNNTSSMPGFVSGGVMNNSPGYSSPSSIPLPSYGPYGNKLPDGGTNNSSSNTSGTWTADLPQSSSSGGGDMLAKAYQGFQQYLAASLGGSGSSSLDMSVAGSQEEGPDGANLFIYHLPQELRDPDLVQMFSPFGKIVSAKVFIDKQTNMSKCFGFVSYDDPKAAAQAIQTMNGTNVGSRRLKVSLKDKKTNSRKPY